MYSYLDIEKIKANLEWIVNQSSANSEMPSVSDRKTIYSLLELIQTYDGLLELIAQYGITVVDKEIIEGLSLQKGLSLRSNRMRMHFSHALAPRFSSISSLLTARSRHWR